ncbi:MAG: branched-chain amino acid ABC transporter permease, partial [Ruminiclostridium sp.]|nr:branched-chain amino acid ABC transporter permease [Ruminiclostridium sp.]
MGKKLKTKAAPEQRAGTILAVAALAVLYVFLFLVDNALPTNSFTVMLIPVLQKGAIFALVCVSMNLLNGFTGLFSLGQAGFMLLGAYTFAILNVPVAAKEQVYYLYGGSAVNFSLMDLFAGI